MSLVFSLLRDPPAHGQQAAVAHYQALQQLKSWPEFSYYLAYILALCRDEAVTTRSQAGLQLKNQVKEQWDRTPAHQQDYVKAAVIESMAADGHYLRNIVGTIVANIAVRCKIAGWPGILQHLGALLDHPNPALQDSAFNALSKICEDIPKELIASNDVWGKPLHFLLPKFLSFFHHPKAEFRIYALTSVNVFLYFMPLVMQMHLDAYMQAVFVLARQDENKEVRRRVCQAFVLLLEKTGGGGERGGVGGGGVSDRPLQPHLDGLINFMLHACNDDDENVALEASEFWAAYCDNAKSDMKALLANYLSPLVATLVKGMRYSDDEIELSLEDDDNNAQVPDKQQDIRPSIHRGKTVRYDGAASPSGGGGAGLPPDSGGGDPAASGGGSTGGGGGSGGGVYGEDYDDDDVDDDDDGFYDEDDDEEVSNWNLRKCSAAALDALANAYGSLLFSHLLPLLKQLLSAPSTPTPPAAATGASPTASGGGSSRNGPVEGWILRESAVLALGAVAEGCFADIAVHLHELIPYLLTFLKDKKPLVRSITCWTLSRYSKWVVLQAEGAAFFQPLLEGLLASILDSNKKVQEAACSAFATFEEEAGVRLQAHLPRILSYLMHAFTVYQSKNMLILYDAIGTLAESVGDALRAPECVALLMPPLMAKWNDIPDDDRAIFPLFECLTSVSTSLGPAFVHYSSPVFLRCLAIISRTLEHQRSVDHSNALARQQGGGEEAMEYVDSEFIVCALDLLSGLAEGLDGHVDALLTAHPHTLQLLFECFPEADTRVLTDHGFLHLHQVEARLRAGDDVLYACYDVASAALCYRPGRLVYPAPPKVLLTFASAGESQRWGEAAAEEAEEEGEGVDCSGHLSLRVTPSHRMYAQLGEEVAAEGGRVQWRQSGEGAQAQVAPPSIHHASSLLSPCHCPPAVACEHRRAHLRMQAYAEAGHSSSAANASTSHRARMQRTLGLSDAAVPHFLRLLGFWLTRGFLSPLQPSTGDVLPVVHLHSQSTQSAWVAQALSHCGLGDDEWDSAGDGVCIRAARWCRWFHAQFSASGLAASSCPQPPPSPSPLPRGRAASATDTRPLSDDDAASPPPPPTTPPAVRDAPSPLSSPPYTSHLLPSWLLMHLPPSDLRLVIDGLRRADAASHGQDVIHTADPALRDQLLQALLHCGFSPYAHLLPPSSSPSPPALPPLPVWAVTWATPSTSDPSASALRPSLPRQRGVTARPYDPQRDGRTFCVEVDHPDHLLFVQRTSPPSPPSSSSSSSPASPLLFSRPVITGNCMQDRDPDVRQSSFALLGDLAKVACTHLLRHLHHFLPLCATNLNPHFSSVCNNASWAVGELAIKAGAAPLAPHVDRLMANLILILCPAPIPSPTGGPPLPPKPVQSSLLENASITIGRLGLVCPQQVSGEAGGVRAAVVPAVGGVEG